MIIPVHIIFVAVVITIMLINKVKGSHVKQSDLSLAIHTGMAFSLLYILFFWGAVYLAPSVRWTEYTYIPFLPFLRWIDNLPNKAIENIIWSIFLPLVWGGIGFIWAEIVMGLKKFLKRNERRRLL